MTEKENKPVKRRPLREELAEIDQQILRLLLKRHNILEKIRVKGRIDSSEEKFLREAWQKEVAKVSRDADLSGRFFSLMQNVTFLPKPADTGKEKLPGAKRREAFNLAPSRQPVDFSLRAPLDSLITRAWLYMAAASGQPLNLAPCTQNDPVVDCIKGLDQMGAAITREDDAIIVRPFQPLGAPDKVLHAGDSEFNLYLFLTHYLGRPSRVKISGETKLKLADFSLLRHILPLLGGRLTPVVPKSNGLPVRLECSGILPPAFTVTPDLPAGFAMALLLSAPFYPAPFSINLEESPQKDDILTKILPILDACGITYVQAGASINLEPSPCVIPKKISVPLDVEIATNLLSFSEPLGGSVNLTGIWPNWPSTNALWKLLVYARLPWHKTIDQVSVTNSEPIHEFMLAQAPAKLLQEIDPNYMPLLVALAVCAALKGGEADLPQTILELEEVADFLRVTAITVDQNGKLSIGKENAQIWNAPSPGWAMALALAACARGKSSFALGNPGIVMELWPSYWSCYNSLPNPRLKKEPTPNQEPAKRRRVLTQAIAVPPEIKEEDWD